MMKVTKKLVLAAVFAAAVAVAAPMSADAAGIGYIFTNVMDECKSGQAANKHLEDMKKKLNDEFDKYVASEQNKADGMQKIAQKQAELNYKFDSEVQKVRRAFLTALEKVAEDIRVEKNLDAIIEAGPFLAAPKDANYTDEALKRLNAMTIKY